MLQLDRTPLHIAAERGHTHIVEILVDKYKANVAARTKDGSTLIHIASKYGHPDTALAFLKKGVPLHMPNKVDTPSPVSCPHVVQHMYSTCSSVFVCYLTGRSHLSARGCAEGSRVSDQGVVDEGSTDRRSHEGQLHSVARGSGVRQATCSAVLARERSTGEYLTLTNARNLPHLAPVFVRSG